MKPPAPLRNLQRWREVQAILLRYGFDILIGNEEVQEVRRLLHDRLRIPLGDLDTRSLPERVRLMLIELGPTYVKLGQIASSRSDLLPAEWIDELSKLQDDVPPFPYEQVCQTISETLGAPPEEIFSTFDPRPIAAASIGQVHRARLPAEGAVVVKVQRPHIASQVEADMEIIRKVAHLAEARTAWGRQYGVSAIIEEFARTLRAEMDYHNEARNADRLRRNMASIAQVRVPIIYWNLVSERVLTMEEIAGIKINDVAALDAARVDRVALAEVFIRSIFQQLLIDGYFHADPHPGNLFVDAQDGTLIFLDLGMMGQFLDEQRQQLGEMVQAILRRDSRAVAQLVMEIGTPYKPVREMALRRDLDQIINRYLNASLAEISFAALLTDLLTAVFRHGIRLPSELTLGIKTLVQAEAVARNLNPHIQVVDILQAVARQLLWQRLNPREILERASSSLQEMTHLLQQTPRALAALLRHAESGKLGVHMDTSALQQPAQHLGVIANRLTAGVILVGMSVGSAIALGLPRENVWPGISILAGIGFTFSMLVGGLLVWGVLMELWRGGGKK